MKIAIDTLPLRTGHSERGIGYYTRYLIDSLEKYSPQVTLLKDTIVGADIVHYPYFDLYFLTLPFRKPTPCVVTVHDVIPLVFPDKFPAGIKGNLKLQAQKLSLHSAKAIITDSYHSKVDITKYLGISENKIYVAHIAVDKKFQKVSQEVTTSIKNKYKLPDTFFLYIGDVNYNKNIPSLIEAFAKVQNVHAHLVLAGKAFENKDVPEVQAVENAISLSQKSDRIRMLGFVPDDDVVALYNLATAYVQVSLYEGFGLPVLEAFSCGTPVVSSDRSSLKEVVGNAALIIDPESINSITVGLGRILSDDAYRTDLSHKGQEQAKKFTQEQFARQTIKAYEDVFNKYCHK